MSIEPQVMSLDFVLEPMTAKHLEAVLEIERAGFTNPWRKQDFEYALSKEGNYCLIARIKDRVIAYVVGFFVLNEYHLADFAVHPDFQRKGVGRRLLTQVLEQLEGRRAQLVTLEVRASNAAAIALYRAFEFQTVAIRQGYYSNPREDALVMLKAIDGRFSDWVDEVVTALQ